MVHFRRIQLDDTLSSMSPYALRHEIFTVQLCFDGKNPRRPDGRCREPSHLCHSGTHDPRRSEYHDSAGKPSTTTGQQAGRAVISASPELAKRFAADARALNTPQKMHAIGMIHIPIASRTIPTSQAAR
jgi:hypothetical protein